MLRLFDENIVTSYTQVVDFLIDQLKFLGLKEKEVRVFTTLSTFGRMNMSKISSRSGMPRTTVIDIVRRLAEQGLVTQEKVGGHYEYVVRTDEIANKLDWIEQRLRPATCTTEPVPEPEGAAVAVQAEHNTALEAHSYAQVQRTVGDVFAAHAGERVMMLLAALVSDKTRFEHLEQSLRCARAARTRLEVLTTTNVTRGLSQYAKELLALLTAYDLRLNFLPPSFCIEHTDIIAFRDVVLLVDHHANVIERVDGERAVAALGHLLRVAREAGWGMDMKMWLEGVLASK